METTHLGGLRIHTVLDSGFFLFQKKRTPEIHTHLNNEVYFIEKGSCTVTCDDEVYSCSEGDILLIPIGASHKLRDLSCDASIYSLRFSSSSDSDDKSQATEAEKLSSLLKSPAKLHSDYLLGILRQLRWEISRQLNLSSEKVQGLLQIFYAEFLRDLSDPSLCDCDFATGSINYSSAQVQKLPGYQKNVPQEYYIDLLDDFFTNPPAEKATLPELANRLHLSLSQTKRFINAQYGISFQQKLVTSRINHSKHLMLTTSLSLEQIAEQIGYNSYNAFFEAFYAQTGKTPSQYRKELAAH